MTQEITEMAEGCGFTRTHTGEVELWLCNKNDLERLVKLVAAKERELCAQSVETIETYEKIEKVCFKFAAKTIRERCKA